MRVARSTLPPPPYKRLSSFATLRSCIFVCLRRITFKLGNFINFEAFFPLVSTVSVADPGKGPGGGGTPPNSLFSYQTEARRAEEKIKTSHPLSKGLYPPLSLPLIGPCQQLKNPAVEGCIGFVLCEVRGFTLVWLIFIFNLFL